MTAQTTTQRTAKHRLAVKERMARYEGALQAILNMNVTEEDTAYKMRVKAFLAFYPTDPAKTP